MESRDLWVESRLGRPNYLVLKGAYDEKNRRTFRMTDARGTMESIV